MVMTLGRLAMLGSMLPTRGAFSTCIVWEWNADWYQAAYPTGNPVIDPTGPTSGTSRVERGGSWFQVGSRLRSAGRDGVNPVSAKAL